MTKLGVEPFSLVLTTSELAWLAGVLGWRQVNLPCRLPVLSDEDAHKLQDSLGKRGWIHRVSGQGWQIDRLLVFLLNVLGDRQMTLTLAIFHRDGQAEHAGLFLGGDPALLVWCGTGQVEFCVVPEDYSVIEDLVVRLGLGGKPAKHPIDSFGDPVMTVQTVWKDPLRARQALTVSGIPESRVEAIKTWIDQLTSMVQVNPLSDQPDVNPFVLFIHKDGLSAAKLDGSGQIVPYSSEQLIKYARRLIGKG